MPNYRERGENRQVLICLIGAVPSDTVVQTVWPRRIRIRHPMLRKHRQRKSAEDVRRRKDNQLIFYARGSNAHALRPQSELYRNSAAALSSSERCELVEKHQQCGPELVVELLQRNTANLQIDGFPGVEVRQRVRRDLRLTNRAEQTTDNAEIS